MQQQQQTILENQKEHYNQLSKQARHIQALQQQQQQTLVEEACWHRPQEA
jgi:hypothetical protein